MSEWTVAWPKDCIIHPFYIRSNTAKPKINKQESFLYFKHNGVMSGLGRWICSEGIDFLTESRHRGRSRLMTLLSPTRLVQIKKNLAQIGAPPFRHGASDAPLSSICRCRFCRSVLMSSRTHDGFKWRVFSGKSGSCSYRPPPPERPSSFAL